MIFEPASESLRLMGAPRPPNERLQMAVGFAISRTIEPKFPTK